MKITVSLDNWSGEEKVVHVNKLKRTFVLYGYSFFLKYEGTIEASPSGLLPECKIYSIMCDELDRSLGTVYKEKRECTAVSESISREASDIYSAAIKLIANVL